MGSPDTPKAPKADYKGDIKSFVSGLKGSFPDVLKLEGKYRDDFGKLNLGDVGDFLRGTGGEQGVVGLGNYLTNQSGKQIAGARKRDIRSMNSQAGITRGFLDNLSPESSAAVASANQQAIDAQNAAKGLTGQEERSAQQFARESSADRGRVLDNSSIASEVLNRDSILTQKRAEASAATNNAYNLANSFYSAPGLQLLSRTPAAYQGGQSYLGTGLGAIGSSRPQLVDIGAGLNLGAASRQNQFASAAAGAGQPSPLVTAGTGALSGAATGATIGSVVPGIGTAVGAVGGALIGGAGGYFASDKRLKKDIRKVGKTDEGLPIYTYKYKGGDKTQMGVMAQDVEKKNPNAVAPIGGGFLGVAYDKIR